MAESVKYLITTPTGTIEVVVIGFGVVDATPFPAWLRGRSLLSVQIYCQRAGWKIEEVGS